MAAESADSQYPSAVVLLTSATVGAVAVMASILAFHVLVGDAATRVAELDRVTSYMYWTQPFIYVMAGLIAFGQCRQDVKAAWAIAEAARARADSAAQVAKAVSPAPIGQICGTVAGERTCVLTDLATPAPILEPVEVQR